MAQEIKEIPKEVEGRKVEIRQVMEIKGFEFPEEKRITDAYLFVVAVQNIVPLFHIAIPKDEYTPERLKSEIKKKVEEYLKGIPKTF